MPWVAGQSGNPKGKAKKTLAQIAFEFKCREYLENNGIAQILDMARSNNKQDRKWALEILMDRGFGRAVQSLDVESTTGSSSSSPIELAGKITDLIGPEAGILIASDGGSGKDAPGGTDQVVLP